LNAPADFLKFKPEVFVSELQVFTQRLLLGIGLINAEVDRRIILSYWRKVLATIVELLEAVSFTQKEDILKKFHLRVKVDFRRTLTAIRDRVYVVHVTLL
jgi:hypothetical protein